MKTTFVGLSLVVVLASSASAARNEPLFLRDAVGVKSYPAAPRLAERAAMAPATALPPAASTVPEEIMVIREWNSSGRTPMRNGFKRTLPDTIELRGNLVSAAKAGVRPAGRGVAAGSDHGTSIWSTVVQVEKAHRLRLHLENCVLPEGAVLWVYGAGEEPVGFDRDLLDDKASIWTPSTRGETVWLDVEVPAGANVSFTIREVIELVDLTTPRTIKPEDAPTCLVDSSCVSATTFDVLSAARRAIAQLQYVKGSSSFVCSGGLLNDTGGTGTPYLLTANHCFSDQTSASSLESYFDFISVSCNGSFTESTAKRVVGSTLLATSANSDFTFVRLTSIPANRALFGWDATTQPNGVKIHRLSHPLPASTLYPQMYSSTTLSTTVGTCSTKPRPNFIYSTAGDGGVYGGSSGSPAILAGGYVVGQLLGSCGPEPSAGCDARNSTVDGAFSSTFPSISQWLDPNPAQGVCTQNATTLCLADSRFAVSATFQAGTQSGDAKAVKLTGDTGYFWFFGQDNVEVVIKVLNACGGSSSGRFWVFAGGLTNVRVTLSVRDVKTGTVKTYNNPADTAFKPIQDTDAFATCP